MIGRHRTSLNVIKIYRKWLKENAERCTKTYETHCYNPTVIYHQVFYQVFWRNFQIMYVCAYNIYIKAIRFFSRSAMKDLSVNKRVWFTSHTATWGFDLHINEFQFKTEKLGHLFQLLLRGSLFLSRLYLLSSHVVADLIFLPSPHQNP